ncbi:MAG TPA: hypothetical protein VJB94_04660 [Candidatus Nanoarchaeia archaeon]|nr:hypothetical protein [Candidatus Nanoarchaeia archaeon]
MKKYDKFLEKVQKPKMKELWDNENDEKFSKEILANIKKARERMKKGNFATEAEGRKRLGL